MDKQISQAKAIILDLWQFRKDSKIKPKVAVAESFDALMRSSIERCYSNNENDAKTTSAQDLWPI